MALNIDLKNSKQRDVTINCMFSQKYYELQGYEAREAKRHSEQNKVTVRIDGDKAHNISQLAGINADVETLRNIAKAITKLADMIEEVESA